MDHDYQKLLDILPAVIVEEAKRLKILYDIDEIILDYGRAIELREKENSYKIEGSVVTQQEIDYIVDRIPAFTEDNRSGLDLTLHRISAIRNRKGKIIGLTLRFGRALYGSVNVIQDLLTLNKSILLMGPPGIGKTTRLREASRILAELGKRVVIVDTSNEIAGEGDIPHAGIGDARRMQVSRPDMQHAVMIEAVENHMPGVIVVDEIGTEAEAKAARTIAERGVQLVATAHGQTIHNLIKNPTLSDLLGGVEKATLSDEEAKRRRTQKIILERPHQPTFDILIELKDRHTLYCYKDVSKTVDFILKGVQVKPEVRTISNDGQIIVEEAEEIEEIDIHEEFIASDGKLISIFPFAVNRATLELSIKYLQAPCKIVNAPGDADLMLTTRTYLKRNNKLELIAQDHGIPVYAVKTAARNNITKFLKYILRMNH